MKPTFSQLGLSERLEQLTESQGFTAPTDIQIKAIPSVLAGRDLMGLAQTGSGKTCAYVLPLCEEMQSSSSLDVVVLSPTRELADQIADEFIKFGAPVRLKVAKVVGGQSRSAQIHTVNTGANVIVATPGRMLDLLSSGKFRKFTPKVVVFDEADEMLDMGFIDEIKQIMNFMPSPIQTLFFSATMPREVKKLADKILTDPVKIEETGTKDNHQDILQRLYVLSPKDKTHALCRLLKTESIEKALIFCRTKAETDQLAGQLVDSGVKAQVLHGDLNQTARTHAIKKFKQGHCPILVATDVAARGLDVQGISHVFNYSLSSNSERHTHRIGRTGRAGSKGNAFTFASPQEFKRDRFFAHYDRSRFEVATVPPKSKALEITQKRFVDSIKESPICEEAKELVEGFSEEEKADFLLRLLSKEFSNMESISGPESVGLSMAEIKRIASHVPSYGRSGNNKKPRGRSHKARSRAKRFVKSR